MTRTPSDPAGGTAVVRAPAPGGPAAARRAP